MDRTSHDIRFNNLILHLYTYPPNPLPIHIINPFLFQSPKFLHTLYKHNPFTTQSHILYLHIHISFLSLLSDSFLSSVPHTHECRSEKINTNKMESSNHLSPPHSDASRPSLGFPLGTALLLIIIFSLSGILSCCYHWDKLRSFRHSLSDSDPQTHPSPNKSKLHSPELRQNRGQSFSVMMPGDEVPKFIAMPCPCEPSRPENVVVTVEKPPPKPPQIPIPLYL